MKDKIGNLKTGSMALAMILCAGVFFMEIRGIVRAAEPEKNLSALQITWDDYRSTEKVEPTVLHFSLEGGIEIDRELPWYPSVVKQIAYRDITGDGQDEVLVYRYFANTATEYTLIDVFEIQEDSVRYLSPAADLEELSDQVWDMTLQAASSEKPAEENSGLLFRLESYEKEYGVTSRAETALVGYREGGWQILERVSWKVKRAVEKVKNLTA